MYTVYGHILYSIQYTPLRSLKRDGDLYLSARHRCRNASNRWSLCTPCTPWHSRICCTARGKVHRRLSFRSLKGPNGAESWTSSIHARVRDLPPETIRASQAALAAQFEKGFFLVSGTRPCRDHSKGQGSSRSCKARTCHMQSTSGSHAPHGALRRRHFGAAALQAVVRARPGINIGRGLVCPRGSHLPPYSSLPRSQ